MYSVRYYKKALFVAAYACNVQFPKILTEIANVQVKCSTLERKLLPRMAARLGVTAIMATWAATRYFSASSNGPRMRGSQVSGAGLGADEV